MRGLGGTGEKAGGSRVLDSRDEAVYEKEPCGVSRGCAPCGSVRNLHTVDESVICTPWFSRGSTPCGSCGIGHPMD